MTKNCYGIGTIQAFLDGELAAEIAESIARHVAACDDCAVLLAEAEEESSIAFAALEGEFNTLVPTQRLWTKINDSIGRERKSFWKEVFAFALRPSTAAFASLIFVAAAFVALVSLKQNEPINYVAEVSPTKRIAAPVSNPNAATIQTPQISSPAVEPKNAAASESKTSDFRIVKANFVKEEYKPSNAPRNPRATTDSGQRTTDSASEPLAGEESYVKTIATLTETVRNRKDAVLDSSSRFAFEKDLAVTDDAIKQMRAEVKKNPKNEAAKQILRASYQNKIDLLNSVAEKNELMASIK